MNLLWSLSSESSVSSEVPDDNSSFDLTVIHRSNGATYFLKYFYSILLSFEIILNDKRKNSQYLIDPYGLYPLYPFAF